MKCLAVILISVEWAHTDRHNTELKAALEANTRHRSGLVGN